MPNINKITKACLDPGTVPFLSHTEGCIKNMTELIVLLPSMYPRNYNRMNLSSISVAGIGDKSMLLIREKLTPQTVAWRLLLPFSLRKVIILY